MDLEYFQNTKIKRLSVGNAVAVCNPSTLPPTLTRLDIGAGWELRGLEWCRHLTNLKHLGLGRLQALTTLEPLKELKELESLVLQWGGWGELASGHDTLDLSPLLELPKLKYVLLDEGEEWVRENLPGCHWGHC